MNNKIIAVAAGSAVLAATAIGVVNAQTPRDPVSANCATVTVTRATSADQPGLISDAECMAVAIRRLADQLDARIKKAREVGAPARTPAEVPLPTVPPPGAFKADHTHYPLNEACHYSCSDAIINRWRPAFAAIGFTAIGHADMGVNEVANGATGHVYDWWAGNRCGGYVNRRVSLTPLPSEPQSGYMMRGDVMHDPASEPVVQALYRAAAALPPCN